MGQGVLTGCGGEPVAVSQMHRAGGGRHVGVAAAQVHRWCARQLLQRDGGNEMYVLYSIKGHVLTSEYAVFEYRCMHLQIKNVTKMYRYSFTRNVCFSLLKR